MKGKYRTWKRGKGIVALSVVTNFDESLAVMRQSIVDVYLWLRIFHCDEMALYECAI
jgi:hypothetical protein